MLPALVESLQRLFRKREVIADREALQRFIDSRASFIAQKGIVEFCRVRAGVFWQKLFTEDEFRRALSVSCWQAYAPALALVCEMVEAALRPAAGIHRPKVEAAIEDLARAAYLAYPVPEGFTEASWAERFGIVSARMAEIASQPSRPVRNMPKGMAELVFAALPIHPSVVTNDADYIHNNIRMNLLRAHEDFLAAADLPRLAAALGAPPK